MTHAANARFRVSLGISIAAAVLFVAHLIWPNIHADNALLVLFGIGVLPWLGYIFKEIEIPGLGKFGYGTFEDTKRLTEATAETVLQLGRARNQVGGSDQLEALAKEYVATRKSLPRGWERTGLVTKLFGRMTAAAMWAKDFDVLKNLRSGDEGMRLSAIAYLYANPDPKMLEELVNTITERETAGFNQYWGLRAISNIVAQQPSLIERVKNELERYRRTLAKTTDRYVLVSSVLRIPI